MAKAKKAKKSAPPLFYVCLNTCQVQHGGSVWKLVPGSVVQAFRFGGEAGINSLKRQGAELEPYTAK